MSIAGLADLPPAVWIVGVYAVQSGVCFLLYAVDKRRAARGAWRVPERTLHLVALLGGWPGAWLARAVLRHKTRKPGFTLVLGLVTAAHVALWAWVAAREVGR